MGSHSGPNRRRFLTSGGALAAFVMSAIKSVRGQTAAPAPYEPQGLLAYGQPSKFVGHIVRRTPGVAQHGLDPYLRGRDERQSVAPAPVAAEAVEAVVVIGRRSAALHRECAVQRDAGRWRAAGRGSRALSTARVPGSQTLSSRL